MIEKYIVRIPAVTAEKDRGIWYTYLSLTSWKRFSIERRIADFIDSKSPAVRRRVHKGLPQFSVEIQINLIPKPSHQMA
jgi:hypothetical protein